jgi:hypothetical protein
LGPEHATQLPGPKPLPRVNAAQWVGLPYMQLLVLQAHSADHVNGLLLPCASPRKPSGFYPDARVLLALEYLELGQVKWWP